MEYTVIPIDRDNRSYKTAVREICDFISTGTLVPFLGAGISKKAPACMPLGDKCISPLADVLKQRLMLISGEDPLKLSSIQLQIDRAPLEVLVDVFRQGYGDQTLEYFRVFDWTDTPNFNHFAIASLVQLNCLPLVITMNFDVLIERALINQLASFTTYSPLNAYTFGSTSIKFPSPMVRILKPHGSITSPLDDSPDRVSHIVTTLSELGERPQPKNIRALCSELHPNSVLLFAGYNSGADWDVFPIISQLHRRYAKVYWIQHFQNDPFSQHVDSFLTSLGHRATILQGDVSILFADCLSSLSCAAAQSGDDSIKEAHHDMKQKVFDFFTNPDINDFALANLMQRMSHFDISGKLYERLLKKAEFLAQNPHIHARAQYSLGFTHHLPTRTTKSIAMTIIAIQLFSKLGLKYSDERANAMVWLGYQYLCTLKPDRIFSALLSPVVLWCTLFRNYHLAKAVSKDALRLSSPEKRQHLKSLIRYYFTDLAHCWANITMLPVPGIRRLRIYVHRMVLRRYFKIRISDPDYMNHGYYWFRELECRLLGNSLRLTSDRRVIRLKETIAGWEQAYSKTGNVVEGANTKTYLALLEHHSCGQKIPELLSKAEELWTSSTTPSRSGLLRVILFRSHMHHQSICSTILDIMLLMFGKRTAKRQLSGFR